MSIDLGDAPVGTPPSAGEQSQILTALGAGTFGKLLLQQPTKRSAQGILSVPLPFAAFTHTLTLEDWRKAVKFTSTSPIAISGWIKSTTGYCKILNFDGTYEAVDGAGAPASTISVASKIPTSPFNTLVPKFYAILPCDAVGTVTGDLTYLNFSSNQLTSFDGTGLSSLTNIDLNGNKLTSFDGTGLSSLITLNINYNYLTSFDGTGLSSLITLDLNGNQLTSFDGTGLSLLTELNLNYNQLTSFDGTGLSSLITLYIGVNYLTSFDGTGLSSLTYISIENNQLTSFDVTGMVSLMGFDAYGNPNLSSLTGIGSILTWHKYQMSQFCIAIYNCGFTGAGLDAVYAQLPLEANLVNDNSPYGGPDINVFGNPGLAADDPTIATANGWVVVETAP